MGGMGGGGGAGGGMSCVNTENKVLAATQIHFGEGNNGQWKSVGFNIDGLVSTGTSLDVCQPNSGGSASTAYPDGIAGIDNSFGKNVLPLWLAIIPTFVTDVNTSLQNGNFNMMLAMDCLPPAGDVTSLLTRLFNGTALGMPAKFDGTDVWPVRPELLSDPMNPASSSIMYANSSVMNLVYDSGNKVPFVLTIPMMNTWITLKLYSAHVTMNLAADHNSATGGIIGGVLKTEEFITEFDKVGAALGLCNTPIYMNLVTTMRQASDIMADGSQDPTKTCDGISIGLSFNSAQVQLGNVGPMIPMAQTCP